MTKLKAVLLVLSITFLGTSFQTSSPVAKLTQNAELLCTNYPQFSEGCKGLAHAIGQANKFLGKI